ncbi:GTPase-activating protein [Coemansia guatemalensis]|uniref:GTPase-activating protein n=1 Tax=Coemansia guatemalensis TaxID=2761395 RepID=A0A9W8HZF1_9FUNG|nr:GTPase-activating protein [Coemansia guatemalensis]
MSMVDSSTGEHNSPPVKKSLRSKRLMRPAKGSKASAGPARKLSNASDTQTTKQEGLQDELDSEKISDGNHEKTDSNQLEATKEEKADNGWSNPTAASGKEGAPDDEDRRHSGTDTETLTTVDNGERFSAERQPTAVSHLPAVDKSASGASNSSVDNDVFVEANETQPPSTHASPRIAPAQAVEEQPPAKDEPRGEEPHQQGTSSPSMLDIIDLSSPTDDHAAKSDDIPHVGAADVESSDKAPAHSAGERQQDRVDAPDAAGDSAAHDFMGGLSADYANAASSQKEHETAANPRDANHDDDFMISLVSAKSQADRMAESKDGSDTHHYTRSYGTALSPSSDAAAGTKEESAADIPLGDRQDNYTRLAASSEQLSHVPESTIAELASEHSRLGNQPGSAGATTGSNTQGHTLSRSSSLRFNANSKRSSRSSGMSPDGRGRPSEAASPASAGAKKSNRRSIMLTSFVPPVGMGGGPSTSSPSRSSSESRPESINEAPADTTSMNGVVEIMAGGKTFKRSSLLDSQLGNNRRSNRISPEAGMGSIRLRPSAEVASQQGADAKSAAKSTLQSISERLGGAVGATSSKDGGNDDDDVEDANIPEWMKEVQRRKREAREKEEAARADAAAAREEEDTEEPEALRSSNFIAAPVPKEHYTPDKEHYSAAKDADRHTGMTTPGDDAPLSDVDLGATEPPPRPVSKERSRPVPPPPSHSGPPSRSIYRSLSASLGISQATQDADAPARQSGPQLPVVPERPRATSQTDNSPTPSQNSIFAAVTSFFGRSSTQQSAPPSATASVATAPPGLRNMGSSNSTASRGTLEFPGMRPSQSSAADGPSADMDMLLHQLETQNQQIMKDNKARVFAETPRTESRPHSGGSNGEDGNAAEVDWDFWGNLINNYEKVTRSEPRKLARSVYRGIPNAVRGTVWQIMTKSRSDPALGARFRRLAAQQTAPGSEDAKHEKQIRHDLARTFPKLDYFRDADGAGQEGLFNVLRAYALFDSEVGYCQGLSFVVGPLLLNMPDEEAFCVLVRLMYTYGLRGHFLPTMDDLKLRLYQFVQVFHETLPWLARHFDEQGVQPSMYVSQWLMTMFAYRLPIELTFRLFDVVFAEGLDCLLRVAIAVLKRSQTRLLSLEFEAIMQYLNDGPLFAFYSHASPDMLVHDANQITSVNSRELQRLRRQYIDEMQRRMEEEEEGYRVRVENEQLKQECAKLRSTLQEVSAKQDDVMFSRGSMQMELDKAQVENQRLTQKLEELEERLRAESAGASSKAEIDQLAQKNVQLNIKNQQLEDSLQDLEDALVQIKTLYAESENQRELMTKKFDDLRRALT